MIIPGKIKIFGYEFTVDLLDEERMHDVIGWCDHNRQAIHVQAGLVPELEAETLIHEILHAIAHFTHLKETSDEERWVQCLGMGFHTVLHDNPLLREYLLKP
jgi:hypothetical protein